MENQQLSEQGPDDKSKRLEYKSPTLRKLGKLSDATLGATAGTAIDAGMPTKISV